MAHAAAAGEFVMEDFVDSALFIVFLPWEVAKGRHWSVKLLAVTVGWVWIFPMLFLVAAPALILGSICALLESLDD